MELTTPTVALDEIHAIEYSYDSEADIALFHINEPRPAVTDALEDGWYVRVSDEAIVGLELHGWRRHFLAKPVYAAAWRAAAAELSSAAGHAADERDTTLRAVAHSLPHTSRLLAFLLGEAAARYERANLDEHQDSGKRLLAG